MTGVNKIEFIVIVLILRYCSFFFISRFSKFGRDLISRNVSPHCVYSSISLYTILYELITTLYILSKCLSKLTTFFLRRTCAQPALLLPRIFVCGSSHLFQVSVICMLIATQRQLIIITYAHHCISDKDTRAHIYHRIIIARARGY